MKKNSLIFLLGLCPLVPVTSRVGFALFIVVEFWILFFSHILATRVSELLEIKKHFKVFLFLFILAITSFFSVISSIFFPIAELTLRFYIYLLSFSYILFLCVSDYNENYQSFSLISFYTISIVVFSCLRELLAHGSISFLVPKGFFSISIVPKDFLVFKFLGTNAGAFILLGVILWAYYSIRKSSLISFLGN